MYKPHRGATAVRVENAAECISDGGASAKYCRDLHITMDRRFALHAVEGSASIKDGQMCLTLCNTHPTEPLACDVHLVGAKMTAGDVVHLSANDIHAHNTFEEPNRGRASAPVRKAFKDGHPLITLPSASVTRMMGRLE